MWGWGSSFFLWRGTFSMWVKFSRTKRNTFCGVFSAGQAASLGSETTSAGNVTRCVCSTLDGSEGSSQIQDGTCHNIRKYGRNYLPWWPRVGCKISLCFVYCRAVMLGKILFLLILLDWEQQRSLHWLTVHHKGGGGGHTRQTQPDGLKNKTTHFFFSQ